MRRRLIILALGVVLVSCSNGKDAAGPSPTSPFAEVSTSSTLPASAVLASILSPEKGSVQGSGGRGMVVDLVFQARDPSLLFSEFRLGGALPSPAPAVKPGHNPSFPGLVVALSTTAPALGGPTANLANLFQIISPSTQPDGSVRVSAVWTNAQASFGSDVDVTLVAFTILGTAPDVVPATPTDLNPTSNPVQLVFHISGGEPAGAGTSTTVAPASAAKVTTTTKAGTGTTTSTKASVTTTSLKPAVTTSTTKAPVATTTSTTKLLGLF